MTDPIQQALQSAASQDAVTRDLAVDVVYLLGLAWLILALWRRAALSAAIIARIVVLLVLAYAASKVLNGLVIDPRPYIVAHVQPLTAVGHDNGFPSDHTLLAAALTASLWWIERRAIMPFAVGTLLVMLGRLGVGAHHTLDVLGSVAIVVVAALVAGAIPMPAEWTRLTLARLRG
jgi:undecaprenyl-diphosphatase